MIIGQVNAQVNGQANRTITEYSSNITCARAFDWANLYYNESTKKYLEIKLSQRDYESILTRINIKMLDIANTLLREKLPEAKPLADTRDLQELRSGKFYRWGFELQEQRQVDALNELRALLADISKPSLAELTDLVNFYPKNRSAFEANSKSLPAGWKKLRAEDQSTLGTIVHDIAKQFFSGIEIQAYSMFSNFDPDWANDKTWKKSSGISPNTLTQKVSKTSKDILEKRVIKLLEEMSEDFMTRRITSLYFLATLAKKTKCKFVGQPTNRQHGKGSSFKTERFSVHTEAAHWCVPSSFKVIKNKINESESPLFDPTHHLYNNVMNGTMELPPIFNRVDYDLTDLEVNGFKLPFNQYVDYCLNQVSRNSQKSLSPYDATIFMISSFDDILSVRQAEYMKNLKDLSSVNSELSAGEPDWDEVTRMLGIMSTSGLCDASQRGTLSNQLSDLNQALQSHTPISEKTEMYKQVQGNLIEFERITKQAIFVVNNYQKALDGYRVQKDGNSIGFAFSETSLIGHLSVEPSSSLQRISSGKHFEKCGPAVPKLTKVFQKQLVTYWAKDEDKKSDS